MTPTDTEFGIRLLMVLKANKMSQEELARMSGITRRSINSWITKDGVPRLRQFIPVLQVLVQLKHPPEVWWLLTGELIYQKDLKK